MNAPTRPAPAAPKAPKAPRPPKEAKTFTITELAQEFDITPRAIRFYEDVGLLEPARAGRNRVYTHGDRTRLKLTLRGKRLGLSLSEVKQLVDLYDSGTDARPQLEAFLVVLGDHRRQLEQQLDDIRVTLGEIEQHEARCRALLAANAANAAGMAAAAAPGRATVPARRGAAKPVVPKPALSTRPTRPARLDREPT